MRELTEQEIDQVSGGGWPALAAIGIAAFVSGATSIGNGGSWLQVTLATTLGGLSAAAGAAAVAVSGAAAVAAYGVSGALGLAANFVPQTRAVANFGAGSPKEREGGS